MGKRVCWWASAVVGLAVVLGWSSVGTSAGQAGAGAIGIDNDDIAGTVTRRPSSNREASSDMRTNGWSSAIAGSLLGGFCATLIGQTPVTVKDGVYTDEQAKRGQTAYTEKCSLCHGNDLSGGGSAPALNGDTFAQSWVDRKLDELASRIKDTMPADEPGSLTAEATADIVAYLLKSNGYAAGTRALPTESRDLQQITITKP